MSDSPNAHASAGIAPWSQARLKKSRALSFLVFAAMDVLRVRLPWSFGSCRARR